MKLEPAANLPISVFSVHLSAHLSISLSTYSMIPWLNQAFFL
jgi:hypothetical protein